MKDTALLNIHALRRRGTRSLGPGNRYVVWTQGCPFRCEGCATPESRPVDDGTLVTVDALADDIIHADNIDGITISGGEPMIQAESIACLLEKLKKARPELTVIIFTGFRIENLIDDAQQRVLLLTDLLIDGPYVDTLNDGRGLRGSSNQRLHFLSPRLEPFREALENGCRNVEISFSDNYQRIVGMPSKL